MGASKNCLDRTTYYDRIQSHCVPCPLKPGHEVTKNCGYDDQGGRHYKSHIECKANSTFNDGSSAFCSPCSSCAPGFISSPCNTTSDTKCQDTGSSSSTLPGPTQTAKGEPNVQPTSNPRLGPGPDVGLMWAVPLVTILSIMLAAIGAFLIYRKWKKGRRTVLHYRRSSYINGGFFPSSDPPGTDDLEHILSSNILSAPLQTVLDDLDVLEDLVILLDPESHGLKNTKHLAYHCSFSATWITYTYSMKDSKSPLKAVLEGVTSRNPDWTVGHLAKLLRQMERNDAIAVLAKLRLSVTEV